MSNLNIIHGAVCELQDGRQIAQLTLGQEAASRLSEGSSQPSPLVTESCASSAWANRSGPSGSHPVDAQSIRVGLYASTYNN